MSKFSLSRPIETVKGTIQIPYAMSSSQQNDSDCSDEDDEEELEDLFSFYGDTADSNNFVATRIPKETKVVIKSADGKNHECSGRFPLTQVFWQVEAKVSNGWLQQPPKYSIYQQTKMVRDMKLVNIFISECCAREKDLKDVENAMKACFESYCRLSQAADTFSFVNLGSMFQDYIQQERNGCCLEKGDHGKFGQHTIEDHSKYLEKYVINSELGNLVLLAASHPALVAVCSELLPFTFTQFLYKLGQHGKSASGSISNHVPAQQGKDLKGDEADQKVQVADEMAKMCPWQFAFKDIIAKKLKIYGTEAKLQTYIQAGYLPKIPQTEKDAIYIYNVLKEDARKNGNMYLEISQLKSNYLLRKLNYEITGDQRWKMAINYLESNNIIKIEVFNWKENIFLRPNWQAEVDVAEALNTVLLKHSKDPLSWEIDLDSPDFHYLQDDDDQMKATQLICHMPLTILSGKGGCGKTTVVTRLLKHLCDREEQRLREEAVADPEEDTVDYSQVQQGEYPNTVHENHTQLTQAQLTLAPGTIVQPDKPAPQADLARQLTQEVVQDLIKILDKCKDSDSQELKEFKKQILLTAPTGKAARLLGCKAKLPSSTLHSVVMSWRKNKSEGNCWTYKNVKVLVVDECSLVSVRLFAAVVSLLLKEAQLQKIILLGDVRQLPSIEPGQFLKDVFENFSNINTDGFGLSVELTTNHRSESELIVSNAASISNRQMPTFSSDQRFHLVELRNVNDDNERDQAIRNLLLQFEDLKSDVDSQFVSFRNEHCRAINELCCQFYNKHSIAAGNHRKKVRLDFQIGDKICLGRNNLLLNARWLILEKYLKDFEDFRNAFSKATQKYNIGRSQERATNSSRSVLNLESTLDLLTANEVIFDKRLEEMRQADNLRSATQETKKSPTHQREKPESKNNRTKVSSESLLGKRIEKLCNGEVFFIMDEIDYTENDGRTTRYVVLSDRDPDLPRVVCAPLRQLRRICRMKHSWARTIHTYQGSESDTVVYMLGKAIPQNWQHVYTAITRGKKSVYIICNYSELCVAINRREPHRSTQLGHRLKEIISRNANILNRTKEDFLNAKITVGLSSLDDSLSDLSESYIQELDQTVAKLNTKSSQAPIGSDDHFDDDFTYVLSASEAGLLDESNVVSSGKVTPDNDHNGIDSELFSLSSWDGEDSAASAFLLPMQSFTLLKDHCASDSSCTDDSDIDHHILTAKRHLPGDIAGPSHASPSDSNICTPVSAQSDTSPSKRLRPEFVNTPFQESFKNVLDLHRDKSTACKKL